MEASGAPDTPTIDALVSEAQQLAQHVRDALANDPRAQQIVAQIEAAQAAIEETRQQQAGEQPPDQPPPAQPA